MNLEKKHNIATDFQQHLAHVWKYHFFFLGMTMIFKGTVK